MSFKRLYLLYFRQNITLICLVGFFFLVGCGASETPTGIAQSAGSAVQEEMGTAEAAPKSDAAPKKARSNPKFSHIPQAYNWVNDFADMIADEDETALSEKIKQYEKATTNEIAIATVETIKPDTDIVEYTRSLGNYWGVGKKGVDNGVVILIDKESRKIRIASGLGLKTALPDDVCQAIIDDQIVPEFKNGNIIGGLDKAVDRIIGML